MTQKKTRYTYRSQNDPIRDDREAGAAAIVCLEPTMTIQDDPDTDINVLMKRFGITDGSLLPAHAGITDPRYYGNWDESLTLRDALDRNREAEARFAQLPAKIRNRFGNDPYALWDFVTDPENGEEAITLGLLARKAPPAPAPQPGTSAPDPTITP